MVGRPSCRLWLDAAKAQINQIKLINKDNKLLVEFLRKLFLHLSRKTKCSR